MPKKYFRRFRKKGARKGRRVPKMSFDKRVLSVINGQRELKVATTTFAGLPILNAIGTNGALDILPEIPQAGNTGAGSANAEEFYRDGNSITVKKIVLRWWISMKTPVDSVNSKAIVRHMILRQKYSNASAVLANGLQASALLENAKQFTGTISSLQTPINKAGFARRMDRRHYISSPTINQAQLDVDGDQTNAFKMGQKTLTFGNGKQITYTTGSTDESNNFPYFMLIGQASPTGAAVQGLELNYTTTCYFYDS